MVIFKEPFFKKKIGIYRKRPTLLNKSHILILSRSLALRLLDCLGEENLDPVLCEAVRLEGAREVIHKSFNYFII